MLKIASILFITIINLPSAFAQWTATDKGAIHGFGTAAVSKLETNTRFYGEGADADEQSFTRDSLIGLNYSVKPGPKTRVVLQALMAGNSANFEPQLDIATFSADVANDLSLFAGRVIAPIWMHSEDRNVGFSQIWIRPPNELYGQIPFRNIDGFGLRYAVPLGRALLKLQVVGGQSTYSTYDHLHNTVSPPMSVSTTLHLRDSLATELRYEYENLFGFRFGYSQTSLDADVVVEEEDVVAAGGINVRQNANASIDHAKLYSVGAHANLGPFNMIWEWANVQSPSAFFRKYTATYLTLAYNLQDYNINATGGWIGNILGNNFAPTEDLTQTDQLDSANSVSLGVNYTKFENLVLKAGVTHNFEFYKIRSENSFTDYTIAANFLF